VKKKLKALGSDGRHLFRARVEKFGERPRWKRFEPAVALANVRLWPGGERVANRLWFFVGKVFGEAGGLRPGDWIEFEARAVRTTTGYRGPDPHTRRVYPVRVHWTLSRPTKIRKVPPPTPPDLPARTVPTGAGGLDRPQADTGRAGAVGSALDGEYIG
jgi:hypothetical protein